MSKPAAAAAAAAREDRELVVKRTSPPPQSSPPAVVAAAARQQPGSPKSQKMKGLFKSKPRTPVDIVKQTRDLLIYADRNPSSTSDSRDSKREEKVLSLRSMHAFMGLFFVYIL